MGAIAYCRIARVVYGASIEELSKVLGQIKVPSTEIAAKTTFTAMTRVETRPVLGCTMSLVRTLEANVRRTAQISAEALLG